MNRRKGGTPKSELIDFYEGIHMPTIATDTAKMIDMLPEESGFISEDEIDWDKIGL
jgi:hypothetical protein